MTQVFPKVAVPKCPVHSGMLQQNGQGNQNAAAEWTGQLRMLQQNGQGNLECCSKMDTAILNTAVEWTWINTHIRILDYF